MSQCRRVPLLNLLRFSGQINSSFWATLSSGSVTNDNLTFAAAATSGVQQVITTPNGTASKSFTAAALISCASGTVAFRFKNTHGAVLDNFSSDLTATATPTVYVFTVTNGSSAGDGKQIFGVVNSSAGVAGGVLKIHASMLIEGSFTAQQIIDRGGIPSTQ